jgi:hypothetical protein
MPDDWYVYFYENGNEVASLDYVSIPFYEGMVVTIHGLEGEFRVTSWKLHHGHPDERPGLHVNLEKA